MTKRSNPLSELDKKLSAEVLKKAQEKTEDMLFDLRLAELRELIQLSQTQIADAMGVKQPTVASLEKKGKDVRLKSLKRYVEAAGCKLRIDIEMPDGSSHGFPI
ncbi:XRE family transcriptional regulator [Shewanella sp. 202IG2-18]|uniref:helix-turn-helix domain-containing protein n=1 Tax=Parashewanella hymeniacidonis TaxID=2807618 RepID=UPI0019619FD5|nr:helix-turn-helix domain-containing protein [Parashewanella hymeniacidonis]MBM7074587.1 XRE family transcriptional regulator [Parashewanella hymeniacidonis]